MRLTFRRLLTSVNLIPFNEGGCNNCIIFLKEIGKETPFKRANPKIMVPMHLVHEFARLCFSPLLSVVYSPCNPSQHLPVLLLLLKSIASAKEALMGMAGDTLPSSRVDFDMVYSLPSVLKVFATHKTGGPL